MTGGAYRVSVLFLKSGCRWCAGPPDYDPPTTRYKRFNRWSRRHFWLGLLDGPARWAYRSWRAGQTYGHRQPLCQSAAVLPVVEKGEQKHKLGSACGGQTPKVHAPTDVIGRPYVLSLTPGTVSQRDSQGGLSSVQAGRADDMPAD